MEVPEQKWGQRDWLSAFVCRGICTIFLLISFSLVMEACALVVEATVVFIVPVVWSTLHVCLSRRHCYVWCPVGCQFEWLTYFPPTSGAIYRSGASRQRPLPSLDCNGTRWHMPRGSRGAKDKSENKSWPGYSRIPTNFVGSELLALCRATPANIVAAHMVAYISHGREAIAS